MNIANHAKHLQGKADKLAHQHGPPNNSMLAVQLEEQVCRFAHNILCKEHCHNILDSLGLGLPAPVTSPSVLVVHMTHCEELRSLLAMSDTMSAGLPASLQPAHAAPIACND